MKYSTGYRFVILFIIFSMILQGFIIAQEPWRVTKINGGLNFDGIPDEQAWQLITPLPITTYSPVFGDKPCIDAVVKVAYDNDFIYFSSVYNYPDSVSLKAVSKKRDYNLRTTDMIGFEVDSYNDKQNAVAFYTTPNGLRADYTVKNDATGQSPFNFTWNTFWDVKTSRTAKSWTSEFRIPSSSLRFQTTEGRTLMGLIVHCLISDKNELSSFPAISPDVSAAYWKPSLSSEMLFEGLKPRKPVYISPYVTLGWSRSSDLNAEKTAYAIRTTPKYDAGADIKYAITNNLYTDITINTDFAQVEADDQKINLSRYSLYFPEKRVFFMEKADVLDFAFDGSNNLFYSRRIGIDDGKAVRIYGGFRLAGRVRNWDIGILDMQTAESGNNPGENFGVFRLKRKVFNENSYMGGMFTNRIGMNGSYNLSYGADGVFRVTGNEYLTAKMAATTSPGITSNGKNSKILLSWERRVEKGIAYDMSYTYSGEDYNPGIGIETRQDYQSATGGLRFGWFSGKNSPVRYQKIFFSGGSIMSSVTGMLESLKGAAGWQLEGKKGYSGSLQANWSLEKLTEVLVLGNNQASVPRGTYKYFNVRTQFNTFSGKTVSTNASLDIGNFFDGWKTSFYSGTACSIGSDFDLGLTYNLDVVKFRERDVSFTNHIAGIKGLLTMTTKFSISAFAQYNTSVSKITTNLRLRYNPGEGNDFYVVYDEGLNTNIYRMDPHLLYSAGRTLLLKYVYTFIL